MSETNNFDIKAKASIEWDLCPLYTTIGVVFDLMMFVTMYILAEKFTFNNAWAYLTFLPIVVGALYWLFVPVWKFKVKNSSLAIVGDKLVGKIVYLFWVKDVEIPLEEVKSVCVSKWIYDKFRGGNTIVIKRERGMSLRFNFARQPEIFVAKAMELIGC